MKNSSKRHTYSMCSHLKITIDSIFCQVFFLLLKRKNLYGMINVRSVITAASYSKSYFCHVKKDHFKCTRQIRLTRFHPLLLLQLVGQTVCNNRVNLFYCLDFHVKQKWVTQSRLKTSFSY